MRPIWTGSVTLGLVNIPVKMYSATVSSDLDLDMLDKKDHVPVRYSRINEKTGREVAWKDIVKGYKYNDKYVVLDDKDFEKASAKKTNTIEISDFVTEEEISSIYYETPYYLAPDRPAAKSYEVLREALLKTKKVGVASFVMRNKEHLAILRADKNIIILNKIRFQEEIKDFRDLKVPQRIKIKPAELKMAILLIDHQTEKFDISKYKDTYSAELMKLIRAKAGGRKIKEPQMKVVHNKTKDLMTQLKASLEVKRKKAS
ncbi:MAG TPA: Ku protein [Chitinophagaceae bacterium]|nr:Ku protein [Chitinophagaceae bacterium]